VLGLGVKILPKFPLQPSLAGALCTAVVVASVCTTTLLVCRMHCVEFRRAVVRGGCCPERTVHCDAVKTRLPAAGVENGRHAAGTALQRRRAETRGGAR